MTQHPTLAEALRADRRAERREGQADRFEPTIEQLRALLKLERGSRTKISRSDTNGNHYIEIAATRHPKGGRHLYVADPSDPTRVFHVARNGNVTHCEGTLPKRTRR